MSIPHAFCRLLLKEVMEDVRQETTARQRKSVWTWKTGNQHEFHGPDGFYWHGKTCCKWAASSAGWNAWLRDKELNGWSLPPL